MRNESRAFLGLGDIRLEEVAGPRIQEPSDAVVRITASAVCGSDLRLLCGTVPGVQPGPFLGHEDVGVVTEVGSDVRNLAIGDRVIVPATIACRYCSYGRRVTTHYATTPTLAGRRQTPRSTVVQPTRAASTACRPRWRAYRLRPSTSSRFPSRCRQSGAAALRHTPNRLLRSRDGA
jgi:NADPH:quinone reductase-like Zn-dependent oxidoreductase